MVINPSSYHVRVFFVEVDGARLSIERHWLVVANMVSGKSFRSINQHLSKQVRMLSAFMHGSIGFELPLNEEFVLLKHNANLLFVVRV